MGRAEVRPSVPAVSTARSFDLVLPSIPSAPALTSPPVRCQGFTSLFLSLTPEEKKPIGRTDQLNAY